MRALLNGTVIAESDEAELVRIEGNWYFPTSSVNFDLLSDSPTAYTCSWKGECQYYTVTVDGQTLPDRAWSYPDLNAGAVERVGTDFSGYVAFWKEIDVTD